MPLRPLAALALAAVVTTGACSRNPPPPPPPPQPTATVADAATGATVDAANIASYRDPAKPKDHVDPAVTGTGKKFMVASEAMAATKVGKDILASGGNAVDAAVGVAFALAVVHPTAGNIGGGGFAVVRVAQGKFVALDFREVAPAAATETMFLDDKGQPTRASLVGHRAAGVPGAVAGLWALHGKLGKKPWADVVAPAIALARDGFELDAYTAKAIANPRLAQLLLGSPASAAIWLPNRVPRASGTTVAIPDLAATLERIRDQGADGFYKGATAAAIVAEMKTGGGIMTAEDLASYQPVWREPLRFPYRGHTIVSMPPPSSGGLVLAMTAGMLREVELGKLAWHGTEHVHRLAEIWKRAFAARNEVLGDPAFVKDMPIAKLTSNAYLDKLTTITDKATPAKDVPGLLEGDHTTHLCVVDGNGMAVSLTTTLNTGFGSGVTVTGAGFLLNNEMDDFTAKPGAPNVFGLVQGAANKIEPGKRMLSSMSPSLVENAKGELVIVAGAGGGPRIITAVWQTISNVVDFGQPAAAAVANPRFHHQHLPDLLRLEAEAIDVKTAAELKEKGHVTDWSNPKRDFGAITAIVRTATGWDGTADPRGGGAAMGD